LDCILSREASLFSSEYNTARVKNSVIPCIQFTVFSRQEESKESVAVWWSIITKFFRVQVG